MTSQRNLDPCQEWPWCQILVHITDIFAQDGLLPEALVPSSRNFPLDSRPECAGKTASLPPDALARYQADRQLYPPEQYLWASGLTRDAAWRYMRSSEKESAMGFPEGFTL